VKIGLHVADFTYSSGPSGLADDLTRIAAEAEELGFARLSVMDHVWQISVIGPPEHDMLEAYTTLGYLAARTSRMELLAWVTAVTYREPGMLAKLVTSLDVLSQGRAGPGSGSAPPGTTRRRAGWDCRSRRPPSASSGWRRPCRSACRCGLTPRIPTRASTISWVAR
jgi:alkanesulfonate monooxygenase SsuD/methylene tetrahydromethanopterin reductase-like flavin-dependent oxidoreductase (luciferase family)